MTFKQLQDQLLDYLQEIQAIIDVTPDKMKHYINRGYYKFVKDARAMQSEYTLTFAANTVSYATEDYWLGVEHVRYNDDTTNKIGLPLDPYPGGYAGLPETKVFGKPRFYWLRSPHSRTKGELGLWPIQSESATVKVWAYTSPTSDLSADGDVPLVKEVWHEALVDWATFQLFLIYSHRNPAFLQRAQLHKANYDRWVAEATYEMSELSGDPQPTYDIYR